MGVLDAPGAPLDRGRKVAARRIRRPSLPYPPCASLGALPHTTLATNSSATGLTFRHTFRLAVGVTEWRLVYPIGFILGSSAGETRLAASLPIKASVEWNAATRPVLFRGGSTTATLDPGGTLVSDPIAMDLAAGDLIAVRTWLNIGNGVQYPRTVGAGGPDYSGSADGFDTSDTTGSTSAMANIATQFFANPIMIGNPTSIVPVVCAVGDSITVGTGDAAPAPNFSWVTRGLNGGLPLLLDATPGYRASLMVNSPGRLYSWPLVDSCTDIIFAIGTNDVAAATSWSTLQGYLTTLLTSARNRGMKVWGWTMLPRTTSTDSWATTGNQTEVAGFEAGGASVRGLHNAWIRAGASGLIDGYIEASDAAESARDSGKWKVTGAANYATADGIHPSTALHTAIGATFSASTFTA